MVAERVIDADSLRIELRVRELLRRRFLPDPWFGPDGDARASQRPPAGNWRTWLILAGRGWGKTATGAHWIRREVMDGRASRVALVGATAADVRDVMVEGISGVRTACRQAGFGADYQSSRRRVVFENGAVALLFSAEEPDRLRGPQHEIAWSDELAAWGDFDTWDQLQFGLRLGDNPRQVVTTTPRPVKALRELIEAPTTSMTRGTTYDNRANLAPAFFDEILKRYEGTRIGRAEIEGELLTDVPGALWTLGLIEQHRVRPHALPLLKRIVIGVDPQAGDGEGAAETGIVVAGKSAEGHGYILADVTMSGSPLAWAQTVVTAYRQHQADRVVAEINNGGAMVESTLRTIDRRLPITTVHASRGKLTRAEPIAALYEKGLVHHVGGFPALEDQMSSYDGTGDSPDRLDAAVWALTDLMLGPGKPRLQWVG